MKFWVHYNYIIIQTMRRLIEMLEENDEHIQIKVDRFLSSEGIGGLGEQPFVCIPYVCVIIQPQVCLIYMIVNTPQAGQYGV